MGKTKFFLEEKITISAETFVSIAKENMQNFKED